MWQRERERSSGKGRDVQKMTCQRSEQARLAGTTYQSGSQSLYNLHNAFIVGGPMIIMPVRLMVQHTTVNIHCVSLVNSERSTSILILIYMIVTLCSNVSMRLGPSLMQVSKDRLYQVHDDEHVSLLITGAELTSPHPFLFFLIRYMVIKVKVKPFKK